MVSDAGARVAVIESQFLDRVLKARKELPDLEHVILVDGARATTSSRWPTSSSADPSFDGAAARSPPSSPTTCSR